MEDEVRFTLPFGILGAIAAPLVRWQLRRIFEHRHRAVEAALESSGWPLAAANEPSLPRTS